MYHALCNITKVGVYECVQLLKDRYPTLKVTVLLQHPNPSLKNTYQIPGSECIKGLIDGIMEDIHFVYDLKDYANCCKKTN